jgi:hypothetical protein
MNDETEGLVFIKPLPPEVGAKIKSKYAYVGYRLFALFKTQLGAFIKKEVAFQPKRRYHKDTSKYMPHQGAQERARRVRQMERLGHVA